MPHKQRVAHLAPVETAATVSRTEGAIAGGPKVDGLALRAVPSCGPDDLLSRPAMLLCENALDCLPVTTPDGRVVGLISLRDIETAACIMGRPFHSLRVQHAMTRHGFSCTQDDTISTVLSHMLRHEVRHLPVVDAAGTLLGLIGMSALKKRELPRQSDPTPEPRESGERLIPLPG